MLQMRIHFSPFALMLCIGSAAFAQPRSLSLQEVVDAAGAIFSGKVTKVWSEHDAATGFIVTYTQVEVQDAVRGASGGRFTFKQYGGGHGGLRVVVADMSYFSEGEEVVAFLYPASSLGLTSPVGTNEGKLAVRLDPDTGKRMVYGNFLHVKMLEPVLGKSALPLATTTAAAPIMEYGRFISVVRQLAQHK
ncbi:hypothetical protein L0337_27540 [candidate division KSB1 bacterium]|nr:hypothetical protein [candidate division KSB1 bacterium]